MVRLIKYRFWFSALVKSNQYLTGPYQCIIAFNCLHLMFFWLIFIIKGYLGYKMITSQNVPSKAQTKNFLISWKNYLPFCRYSSFCIFNHPMIYQISDVTIWVLVHEARCIFEYIFWTTNHKVTKLGQWIDISKYNNFQ